MEEWPFLTMLALSGKAIPHSLRYTGMKVRATGLASGRKKAGPLAGEFLRGFPLPLCLFGCWAWHPPLHRNTSNGSLPEHQRGPK
jgi:hypothetical protein